MASLLQSASMDNPSKSFKRTSKMPKRQYHVGFHPALARYIFLTVLRMYLTRIVQEFTIQVRNTTPSNLMCFDVDMDGIFTNSRHLRPGREQMIEKCRPSPTTYQYFTFSQGQLVGESEISALSRTENLISFQDDDELPTQSSNMARLGTITISVFSARLIKNKNNGPCPDYRKIDIPDQRSIPEREKKGIQECIGYAVRNRHCHSLTKAYAALAVSNIVYPTPGLFPTLANA